MKRDLTICTMAIFIIAGCTQKAPKETTILGMGTDYALNPVTLKGKVKEVKEINYRAVDKDGKYVKGEYLTLKDLDSIGFSGNLKAAYDMDGNLIRYDLLDKEDIRISNIGYKVDGVYKRWESRRGDSAFAFSNLKYNESGMPVTITRYRPKVDTIISTQELRYDYKGMVTNLAYYNSRKKKISYNTCLQEKNGNIVVQYYYLDTLRLTFKNRFDHDGNLTMQEGKFERPAKSNLVKYTCLKKDDNGNWTEILTDIDNGKTMLFSERTFVYY